MRRVGQHAQKDKLKRPGLWKMGSEGRLVVGRVANKRATIS